MNYYEYASSWPSLNSVVWYYWKVRQLELITSMNPVPLSHVEICWNLLKFVEICWNVLICVEIYWHVLKCVESSTTTTRNRTPDHQHNSSVVLMCFPGIEPSSSSSSRNWVMLKFVEICWNVLICVEICWHMLKFVEIKIYSYFNMWSVGLKVGVWRTFLVPLLVYWVVAVLCRYY